MPLASLVLMGCREGNAYEWENVSEILLKRITKAYEKSDPLYSSAIQGIRVRIICVEYQELYSNVFSSSLGLILIASLITYCGELFIQI